MENSYNQRKRISSSNVGQIALYSIVLLMSCFVGLRMFRIYDLVMLLQKMKQNMRDIRPAMNTPKDGQFVIDFIIALLAENMATTIVLAAAVVYIIVVFVYMPWVGRLPPDRQTKRMLRTMGTVVFYFSLLPDSMSGLVLFGQTTALAQAASRRVASGQLSPSALAELGDNYPPDCPDAVCFRKLDAAGPKAFAAPVRRHLRRCLLPETVLEMALILLAFVFTHLVRGRQDGQRRRQQGINYRHDLLLHKRAAMMRAYKSPDGSSLPGSAIEPAGAPDSSSESTDVTCVVQRVGVK